MAQSRNSRNYKGSSAGAKSNLQALLAGLLTAAVFTQLNAWLIWISFVPLFMLLDQLTRKGAMQAALCFGGGLAAILFWWMIPGARRFTGSETGLGYGLVAFLISSSLLCLYFCVIMQLYRCLKLLDSNAKITKKSGGAHPDAAFNATYPVNYGTANLKKSAMRMLLHAVTLAGLFVVAAFLLQEFTRGLPWLHFQAGLPLATSLVLIQPVSLFGAPVLTFVVILVNALIAFCIKGKTWKLLWLPIGVVAIYAMAGYFLLNGFGQDVKQNVKQDVKQDVKQNNKQEGHIQKKVMLAMLCENISPQIKWDSINGNQLAARLLHLSRQVVGLSPAPDIALWSESAIPWTYQKDDDLVNAILQNTRTANITHLLGVNTATTKSNVVYNSIYELDPTGKLISRYDKQDLLALIEKPLDKFLLPFLSSAGFTALPGPGAVPLATHFGKAGILICNESTDADLARQSLKQGATFFCNPGNDGWFADTYLTELHFYGARLRAVETRKDVVINSNMGFCGLIQGSGNIVLKQKSHQPALYSVKVQPNNFMPFVARYPHLLVLSCLCFLLIMTLLRFKNAVNLKH